MTRDRCLSVMPLPDEDEHTNSKQVKTDEDRLTSFGKIRCCDKIPDQSEICYCGYYCGAYGHPERLTSSEAVGGTVLDTKGGNSHDV